MKPILYPILAAIACGFAYGQTAFTNPVGYVSLGGTESAQPAIDAETDQTISLPLNKSAVYSGAVSSSTATTITFAGTPFASSDFTTNPHIVEVTSGAKQGAQGLISSHTSSTLTVSSVTGADFSSLGGETVKIRPAFTVGELMANASVPAQTQFLAYTGTAAGIYVPNDVILEWDGSNWIDIVNTGEPADNTVVYCGESFIIRNPTQTPIPSLVISGEVLTNKFQLMFENIDPQLDQDIPMSYASTVPETVADSGISAFANTGDQILITDSAITGIYKSSSVILEWDGSNWIDIVNTGEPAETTTYIGAGYGFTYRRLATETPTNPTWTQDPTYIPNL